MIALALPASNDEGFVAPTLEDMHLPEILPWGAEYGEGFGKQMLLILLSVILIGWFFIAAARKGQMVPGRLQFLGEWSYNFVRNSIGRDIIGERDGRRGRTRPLRPGREGASSMYCRIQGSRCAAPRSFPAPHTRQGRLPTP